MTHIEELIGKGKKQISMDEVPIESVCAVCRGGCGNTAPLNAAFQLDELKRVNGEKLFLKLICLSRPSWQIWRWPVSRLTCPSLRKPPVGLRNAWRRLKNKYSIQLASPSISIPRNNSRIFFLIAWGWNHPTAATKPPADITPPQPACWICCEADTRCRSGAGTSGTLQIEINLCRCAAGRAQSRDRLCAYFLQSDRRGNGTFIFLRPEPAKHSHPHGRRTPHSPRICRWQRPCIAFGRLLAD